MEPKRESVREREIEPRRGQSNDRHKGTESLIASPYATCDRLVPMTKDLLVRREGRVHEGKRT